MATITSISYQKRNKSRVNVYIDDEFYGGMSALVVAENRLKVGEQVSIDRLDELMRKSQYELAKDAAIKHVSRSLKTERELRRYLPDKEFEPDIIDKTVELVINYSYINDTEYAVSYVATHTGARGKKRLEFELKNKGVAKNIIDFALQGVDDESQTALALAQKYIKNKPLDQKNRKNLSNFLYSRGFEWEVYEGVINKIFTDGGEDND